MTSSIPLARAQASSPRGGRTALHVAAAAEDAALLLALLQMPALDLDAPDASGATPMHLAAAAGQPKFGIALILASQKKEKDQNLA